MSHYLWVVVLALFGTVVAEAVALAEPAGALVLMVVFAWIAVSGVIFAACLLSGSERWVASSALLGPILGCGSATVGILLFWALGVQNAWALIMGPAMPVAVGWLIARRGNLRLQLPSLDGRDVAPLAGSLLLVPLITLAPYLNVRQVVPEGEAYRAYFTADFIWAMSATAEIARGDVPPVNPFHYGEPMRYYWMSHLLSGVEYRVMQPAGLRLESVLLVNGLLFGLAFLAFAYWLVRSVGGRPWWAFGVLVAGFTANSYEGVDMIRAIVSHHEAWERLRDTNIDAVTRWFYKGMAVDGLHRLLLYQPHHLTGYALGLAGLWLLALASDVTAVSVALWTGVLLGTSLLFSTFSALIISVAVAVLYICRLVQRRSVWLMPQCAILAGGPIVLAVALTRILGYTDPAAGRLMTVGLNPVAVNHAAWVWFLSFGPLLLLGLPSLGRLRWLRSAGAAPGALAIAATAFYFFVDVPDMGGVWVGWRTGHLLLIAFVAAAGSGLTALWTTGRDRVAFVFVAVAILLAVPTVAIDVFNAQDTANHSDGAGFPWTLIITPAEREAFDWIRANTPADAVIQAEPFARDPATWAYVPAFAERRMAAGLPISMVPHRHYAAAAEEVRLGIFGALSAADAHEWAELLTIDYILVGDRERRTYGPQVQRMLERVDLFKPVFRNEAILLLQVLRNGGDFAHQR